MNRNNAFTLIELLIIVIISSILIGMSVPRFRSTFDKFELGNSIKDIFYLSRYLQGASISQGRIYCLNIDKKKGEIRAAVKEEDEFKDVKGRLGNKYNVPLGVIITTEPIEKNEVYFYPDGNTDKISVTFENQHKDKGSLLFKGAARRFIRCIC
ncbi:MAG: prepilin-type N-terminal cleavage/methylation domain-containing protein [Candidatus Omnitrophica bacterium]|nr:prepilin-type N-terminal cleavage/methylation domain-containing protein [Candidatus Omnitrophota bacterium]